MSSDRDAVIYAYENVGVANDSPDEVGRVVGYAAPLRVAIVYAYENVEEEGS